MAKLAKRFAPIALGVALLLAAQAAPASAMDQQKHDEIAALIRATGSMDIMRRGLDMMLPQIIGTMKKLRPDVPAAVWAYLQQEGRAEFERSLGELEEPMITLYDRAFSEEDVKQLLAFYESPIGRKMLATMPQLMQQSAVLGKAWGEAVGQRITARLREKAKAKGYDL